MTGARFVRPQARGSILVSSFLLFSVSALPWLYIFKYVAFDVSSTDNLNELIAGNGAYLYPLLILLPINAIAVAHAFTAPRLTTAVVAAVVIALSLPLGWYLVTSGLSAPVQKYGLTFTGADFLLGPDRRDIFPRNELMLRWAAVQLCAVAALAFGMRILLRRRLPGPANTARNIGA